MSEWQPVSTAKPDGTLCKLRFRDALGSYESDGPFFLHDDGDWYRVDPPTKIVKKATYFLPIKKAL